MDTNVDKCLIIWLGQRYTPKKKFQPVDYHVTCQGDLVFLVKFSYLLFD